MREVLLALGLFVALAAIAVLVRFGGFELLARGGLVLIAAGLAFSLPCAVRYHVLLYRALEPRKQLDRKWIWGPVAHHARLRHDERARVLPWFWAGAFGWFVVVAGCVLLGLAVLKLE